MMEIKEILAKVKELKEIEQRAKAARVELEKKLFESVDKPIDGKPLWLSDEAKIVWRNEAKIPQKVGKIWLEKNPELSKRVFSISVKPKISVISQLERTLNMDEELPPWMADFEALKKDITIEEKPRLEFLKEEVEEDE
ncbi:MAG: hypothetical protein QM279_10670 [Atribacterota bacterium]|nr:hypothetical protein [Atribacterota bacterium]